MVRILGIVLLIFMLPITSTYAKTSLKFDPPSGSQQKKWKNMVEKTSKEMVKRVNRDMKIPKPLTIHYGNDDGPLFNPDSMTIHMPYGFIGEVYGRLKKAKPAIEGIGPEEATTYSILHTLLHEYAHAYLFSWDIPVLGKEEDAADTFAMLVILNDYEDEDAAYIAADLFGLEDLAGGDYYEEWQF